MKIICKIELLINIMNSTRIMETNTKKKIDDISTKFHTTMKLE